MPHYRKNAIFVLDPSKYCTQLDRNQKAKILHLAERLERATKRKGRRNGVLGLPALTVLRVLLLRYHGPSGLCCPSYSTLQKATGLCRQTIASALARLRVSGLLRVTHRLVRTAAHYRQTSNLYSFRHFPRLLLLNLLDKSLDVRRNSPKLFGVPTVAFKRIRSEGDNVNISPDVAQQWVNPIKTW